jgi:hypothetical protein
VAIARRKVRPSPFFLRLPRYARNDKLISLRRETAETGLGRAIGSIDIVATGFNPLNPAIIETSAIGTIHIICAVPTVLGYLLCYFHRV